MEIVKTMSKAVKVRVTQVMMIMSREESKRSKIKVQKIKRMKNLLDHSQGLGGLMGLVHGGLLLTISLDRWDQE